MTRQRFLLGTLIWAWAASALIGANAATPRFNVLFIAGATLS